MVGFDDHPLPRIDGAFDNRLTLAEVRRALFRTKDGFLLFFGMFFGGIPLGMAVLIVAMALGWPQPQRNGEAVPIGWVLPFLSVFIAVGGSLAFVGIRGLRRRLKILRAGLQVWGKNLGVREDPSMTVNDRPCRLVAFEYVDFTGQTHVGQSSYLSDETIARLEGLETVPVVYLAQRPEDADLDLDRL
jgi:hypothetical protein